jgi:hypothetical protein
MSSKLEYEAWIANELKKQKQQRQEQRPSLQIPLPDYGVEVDDKYKELPSFL